MICGKKLYETQRAAASAIKLVKKSSSRSDVPRRAYWCKICQGYHLTKVKKEIDYKAMEKLDEIRETQAREASKCPECLQPTSQEELKTYGGLCEDCNTGL